jgi:hypothetical protein
MPDPRVFFAAERTVLAWAQSGLTMMAFGFVVARFGLFLGLLPPSNQSVGTTHHFDWISSTPGIALVVLVAAVSPQSSPSLRPSMRWRLPDVSMTSGHERLRILDLEDFELYNEWFPCERMVVIQHRCCVRYFRHSGQLPYVIP